MKIVVFGLTISSSWGNGHATLWRGLCRSLARLGHRVVFYERDVPYYAGARDLFEVPGGELVLYGDWEDVQTRALRDVAVADVAIVTSYCPDGLVAGEIVQSGARALSVFYDLDTPVTLSRLQRGDPLAYIGPQGLGGFDLVLSYTGGGALQELRERLGAQLVLPLYGHVDPEIHKPAAPVAHYQADLSYLGTFAADRQQALESLFMEPARLMPERRFLMGGAQYPQDFPWSSNVYFVRHLPPSEHPAFYSSSRLTLNVTRREMAAMGWCPSGRLFEAAACGTAIISDVWEGIEAFFSPGEEILTIQNAQDCVQAIELDDAQLRLIGAAARECVLARHTSAHRAQQLLAAFEQASRPLRAPEPALEEA
ncbi:MAG TPA: glycosyltransferase [Xanthobacteraceae bacterium]|nr:glycosyltransferase [Xanthobacteraceae bacterium]